MSIGGRGGIGTDRMTSRTYEEFQELFRSVAGAFSAQVELAEAI